MASSLRSRKPAASVTTPDGISMQVVRDLAAKGGISMVIKGVAYDFTNFANDHPGGAEYLRKNAGKDATEEFEASHPVDIIERTLTKAQFETMPLGPVDPATVTPTDVAKHDPAAAHAAPTAAGPVDVKPSIDTCINLYDFEAIAARTVPEQGWAYYSSGADDEITLRENHNAFQRIWFRPRVLVNVRDVDMSTSILGHKVELPVFLSAVAMCKLGHPEGEVAWQQGAGREGVVYMIPTLSSCSLDEIVAARQPGQPMFFQLYVNQDRDKTKKIVERAEAAGCSVLFITVDAPQLGNREKDRRVKVSHAGANVQKGQTGAKSEGTSKALTTFIDPSLEWADIPWFQSITKMKIVLKGVATADDAVLALEAGVAGVLLSNHGGRQLDFAPSGIEVLPETMEALRKHPKYHPSRFEVYVDGGVRRGTDIFKALALGATAVGVGRPALYAMSAFGADGVQRMLQILKDEFAMAMRLNGVKSVKDISPKMVVMDQLTQHMAPVPTDYLQIETYIRKSTQAQLNAIAAEKAKTTSHASAPDVAAASAATTEATAAPGVLAVFSALVLATLVGIFKSIFSLDARTSVHRTALFLLAFLVVHVLGNLLFFAGADSFNAYGAKLHAFPLMTAIEIYLLAAGVLHAGVGAFLTFRYKLPLVKKSPGLKKLEVAKLAVSGAIILAFVVVHLLHFRFGVEYVTADKVRDLYRLQLEVFQSLPVALFYVASTLVLGVHLYYGWEKTVLKLQGLGRPMVKPVAVLGQQLVIPVTLGFVACVVGAYRAANQ